MADRTFRWRSVLEVSLISAVIYFLIGTPGFPATLKSSSSGEPEVPAARAKIESLVYPRDVQCLKHQYETTVFSTSPLVIYIEGFLSNAEADHLVSISKDKWQVSTVFNGGIETTDDTVRRSEKALIDRDDVVQCIEQRALSFQGWPQETFIERLWTQRYNVSGHYAHHYDWASESKSSRRVSTFMVYLSADCEGGGTHFPRLEMPQDRRWCQYIECGDPDGNGGAGKTDVTFKPRKGSAVFWTNFDAEGRGFKDTIHAGMPVRSGTKIGLNIWSWYLAGHKLDMMEV